MKKIKLWCRNCLKPLLCATFRSKKEQKVDRGFPSIEEQLSTQDTGGTMFYFTADGGFHSIDH